jgi:hypothetical protein
MKYTLTDYGQSIATDIITVMEAMEGAYDLMYKPEWAGAMQAAVDNDLVLLTKILLENGDKRDELKPMISVLLSWIDAIEIAEEYQREA